jgi:hypothetical protein
MKWFHVTSVNRGKSFLFTPYIPYRLQKGEDKRTPRICVTANWHHSLRSIIMIHLSRFFYVYSSKTAPISPQEMRESLLRGKKIPRTRNDFRVPQDGIINKEHWFLNPISMVLEGHIRIPEDDYAAALMGLGMFNYPDVEKLKLTIGLPDFEKEFFRR